MIRLTVNEGQHLEDGDIIRLLDGECAAAEEESIRAHLEMCAECRRAADELELLSQGFSRVVGQLDVLPSTTRGGATARADVPVVRLPRTRWTRTRILKAAAVVALVTTAVAVSPARAWLIGGFQAIRSLFEEETIEAPRRPVSAETPEAAAVVSFRPAGSTLSIEVSSTQPQGTIALTLGAGLSASAVVLGGHGDEELIVLPEALRIMNSSSSSASYEIVVPRSVRLVRVSIAGRMRLSLDAAELSDVVSREIELSERR